MPAWIPTPSTSIHGLTGTLRERPGPGKALAACRNGDATVVTMLDWLARSPPDAWDVADKLTRKCRRLLKRQQGSVLFISAHAGIGTSTVVGLEPIAQQETHGNRLHHARPGL
ncbi:recombinase family protein [Paenarthrobacter sp. NPDC056912]|uniref:recombinase family protein n=1 Tax=Paenarthrobacter sp. NPDC056912 TaxID=3345965 RepID=UPI00367177FB